MQSYHVCNGTRNTVTHGLPRAFPVPSVQMLFAGHVGRYGHGHGRTHGSVGNAIGKPDSTRVAIPSNDLHKLRISCDVGTAAASHVSLRDLSSRARKRGGWLAPIEPRHAKSAYQDHERLSVTLASSTKLSPSSGTLAVAVHVAPSSNLESTYSTSMFLSAGVNVTETSRPLSSERS